MVRYGLTEIVHTLDWVVENTPTIELPVRGDVNIGDSRAVMGHPGLQQGLLREELVLIVLRSDSPGLESPLRKTATSLPVWL